MALPRRISRYIRQVLIFMVACQARKLFRVQGVRRWLAKTECFHEHARVFTLVNSPGDFWWRRWQQQYAENQTVRAEARRLVCFCVL